MKSGYFVFDGDTQGLREEISQLHAQLIPYGPVPRLGIGFMQNIYYRILPAKGWLRCDAYSFEGRIVGFFTSASPTPLRKALGLGGYVHLMCEILAAVLKSPGRLSVVLDLLRRSSPDNKAGAVEMLSFGVEEKLRNYKDPTSRKRISTLLFENCLSAWKQAGVAVAYCQVKRDNLPMLLFYKNSGAEIMDLPNDPTSYEIIFYLDRWSPSGPPASPTIASRPDIT